MKLNNIFIYNKPHYLNGIKMSHLKTNKSWAHKSTSISKLAICFFLLRMFTGTRQ